jgi:hypothetical protein
MTVKKWVESSQEVEIQIDADDIRCALSEAFDRANPRDCDDHPNRGDVTDALNAIGGFMNGLTEEHLALLSPAAIATVAGYFERTAARLRASLEAPKEVSDVRRG